MVNKRVQNAVFGCSLKNDSMISVHFQGKPLNITVIKVSAPIINAEEAEVDRFYEDLQDLLELTPIPKNGNDKECSNYHTIALISYANKVMPKLRERLQQYVN